MRDWYAIGIASKRLARFVTRSRVSLSFASAPSKPAITPCRTPNSRNATAIDNTVSTVRIGLRHKPAHSSGRYFICLTPRQCFDDGEAAGADGGQRRAEHR